MKMKKLISLLLAVLMISGAFVTVVGAEEAKKPYTNKTFQEDWAPDYSKKEYASPEEKLEDMDFRYGTGAYELYVDAYSGEVAVVNVKTGESLFSNPYNVASLQPAKNMNKNLELLTMTSQEGALIMSQLVVHLKDIQKADTIYELDSYKYAAARKQIKVKDIKGGLRVEYSIGIEETRIMVPDRIPEEDFNKKIKSYIDALPDSTMTKKEKDTFYDWFVLIDPDEFGPVGSAQRNIALSQWGVSIDWEGKFYATSQLGLSTTEKKPLAQIISEYCPMFSFEDIDDAYIRMGYSDGETVYPVVKMALEYTLDENGLSVRLPANGIRFDESRYSMESIEILPYMGVGITDNGYTFFPDGSGTLFSFKELMDMGLSKSLEAKVYGSDYAYQKITGNYEETVRYPVVGLYETLDNGRDRGFLAIVEEGESLATLKNFSRSFKTAGEISGHLNGVQIIVNPRQKDSLESVGWDVVSSKKFTGSVRIRYMMLTDADLHADLIKNGVSADDLYDCSYVGMAKAYRTYLVERGVLTKLTAEQVDMENIPLYIETLGSMMTTKKILSIPVNMMSALTSFSDIITMRDELAEKGVTNIQFIMNGYTKGGLSEATVPYNLKWDGSVSDGTNFEELLEDAKEEGYGIFPNFDFVFAGADKMFDGLNLREHAVKTVENRYTTKREYSATKHTTVSTFEIALSPAYFSHFYEKFLPKYADYNPMGISVDTLGSYLNSDFDEEEPFNREENKQFTIEAFKAINSQLANAEIMTEAANAYTWGYVDHITDIALDSSRFKDAYATVPFLGMVLHGYVELAGTPVNMEGNLDYAMLKSIESGAALQFLLAYDNTEFLKNDSTLSQNFSVQYQIWRDDIIEMYTELNGVLKNVQTSVIVDHQFISGVRVPDLDELERDSRKELEDALAVEAFRENVEKEAERAKVFAARLAIIEGTEAVLNAHRDGTLKKMVEDFKAKYTTQLGSGSDSLYTLLRDRKKSDRVKETAIVEFIEELHNDIIDIMDFANNLVVMGKKANEAMDILKNAEKSFSEEILNDLQTMLTDEYEDAFASIQANFAPETIRASLLNTIENTVLKRIDSGLSYGSRNLRVENIELPEFSYVIVEKPSEDLIINGSESSAMPTTNRYQSDENMIVREKFENGADFLLNFNDYQVIVIVPVNDKMTSYTIDAYGYVVLNHGTNQ